CGSAPTRCSRPASAASRAGSCPASSRPAPTRGSMSGTCPSGGKWVPFTPDDFPLFPDAVDSCRANGVAVFGAAGNQHVRVDRVSMDIGDRELDDVGRVSLGSEGMATASPGSDSLAPYDLRGWLVVPAGVPGVTMVSATANAIGGGPASVPLP